MITLGNNDHICLFGDNLNFHLRLRDYFECWTKMFCKREINTEYKTPFQSISIMNKDDGDGGDWYLISVAGISDDLIHIVLSCLRGFGIRQTDS